MALHRKLYQGFLRWERGGAGVADQAVSLQWLPASAEGRIRRDGLCRSSPALKLEDLVFEIG